jgi:orotidine-5'-phosphate decarboxylase
LETIENPIIIALDFSTHREIKDFLNRFDTNGLSVKVGMELFYQNGPAIITDLKEQGCQIFLDLKLHDIPNTVKRSMNGLAGLGIDIVNVHAGGGRTMMEAAIEGLDQGTPASEKRPACIAVTQLTSTTEQMMNQELLIHGKIEDIVVSYASLAQSAGLDGVVCSPLETPFIKKACGSSFMTITPGIRLKQNQNDDQARVTTPKQARELGSDYIVVGRIIIQATDPVQAYKQILEEWSEADE